VQKNLLCLANYKKPIKKARKNYNRRESFPSFLDHRQSQENMVSRQNHFWYALIAPPFPPLSPPILCLPGRKNCSFAKLLAESSSPPNHTPHEKLSLWRYRAPPDPMPPLNKSPSHFGGRQRNSWATQIYPSSTLPAKQFARFALLSMK